MSDFSWLGRPIDVRDLFPPERRDLLDLLRGLSPEQWRREAVPGWTVKDLAAHVLGDDYGRLASERDGYQGGPGPGRGEPFPAFIHRINQEWVDAAARISPAALIDTLELTGRHVAEMWRHGDPYDAATWPVSWAGADPAPRWLDCARDLTEYWVHRQQIRLAVGLGAALEPGRLRPVLDTFMRALPCTLRDVPADDGTRLQMVIDGPAGGTWTATAVSGGWSLAPATGTIAAVVRMDADTAWRLCTRMLDLATAVSRSTLEGERRLCEAACRILSIIR